MPQEDPIYARLIAIPWFINCGEPFTASIVCAYQKTVSWKQASTWYHKREWEDIRLEAANRTTEHLYNKFHAQYQEWNEIVEPYRQFLSRELIPKWQQVQQQHGLDEKFVHQAQWNVIHAMMEIAYARYKPQTFFRELLKVYEAGHFPCGWTAGEWPAGKLVLY